MSMPILIMSCNVLCALRVRTTFRTKNVALILGVSGQSGYGNRKVYDRPPKNFYELQWRLVANQIYTLFLHTCSLAPSLEVLSGSRNQPMMTCLS